jgi:hypothetical protein
MAYITFYLNGSSLSNATAVFTDIGLTTLAANGYYSNGAISRQQVSGVLQEANVCPTCEAVACASTTSSGGAGVTEYTIDLEPAGGFVAFDCRPYSRPDKFEILHNGIKVATSGMTVVNAGPFDNLYGDPTIPDLTQALSTDQFIGISSTIAGGVVPTREAAFQSATGSSTSVIFQQMVWWVYTSGDYSTSPSCVLRITGPDFTGWDFKRICV